MVETDTPSEKRRKLEDDVMISTKVPNIGGKIVQDTIQFLGLNLSENFKEGEISDSRNLTTEKFPVISQRKKREKVLRPGTPPLEWSDPTQIWEWDGKLLVIDEGTLYYNGEEICHVADGQKQFAVVNTKLIVWPDKIMIDLTDNTYDIMNAEVLTGADVTMTTTKITAPEIAKIYTGARTIVGAGSVLSWTPICWTFGTDPAAVEACFVNGEWDLEALAEIAVITKYWANGGGGYHILAIGDIIIPKISNGTYTNSVTSYPERPAYPDNNVGIYGVLTSTGGYYDYEYGGWGNIESIYNDTRVGYFFDAYQCGAGTSVDLTTMFSPGEWIEISNTNNTDVDGVRRKIASVTSTTITVDTAYASAPSDSLTGVSIKKSIPDMDYICEKDNRLWGCSNSAKTIYCSALGIPTDFYTMEGTDTDAYSVAIGSEGDFTGIYSFGGGVCCFKPDRLIKILGSYPSEFYMNEYRIFGIQPGSNRSTIIINEVLYYKSENGIFAYSGGTPTLISGNLGVGRYTEAVTGASGNSLYVCMKDGSGRYGVYVYDMKNGLWIRESSERILSFTNISGKLYSLIEDAEANYIVCYSNDGDEVIEWLAEFVPFTEDTFRKKSYSMLRVRVEMSAGSVMYIDTKSDNGAWKTALRKQAGNDLTFAVPLKINRCDRFCIRFRGTGRVTIRAMSREFHAGSARR